MLASDVDDVLAMVLAPLPEGPNGYTFMFAREKTPVGFAEADFGPAQMIASIAT